MYVRALYINPVTASQVELSASHYDDQAEVNGATSYGLSWRAAGGKWKMKAAKGTRSTIKGLKSGKCYVVHVRAKAGFAKGAWSKSSGRWLKKVSSVKAATGSAKGSVKVSWDKDAQANSGYVVQVCKKVGGKTSATIKGLKSGKAYYVKVRPVRKASSTTCMGVQRYYKMTVKAR